MRGIEFPVVGEEHEFKVDLRIEGTPHDATLEDQERMTKIQKLADKLRAGYYAESIITEFRKRGNSNRQPQQQQDTMRSSEKPIVEQDQGICNSGIKGSTGKPVAEDENPL